MEKVNALKYLVEINQASGGTSRDKPIPKLLLSMGERFLKEKREWTIQKEKNLEESEDSDRDVQEDKEEAVKNASTEEAKIDIED